MSSTYKASKLPVNAPVLSKSDSLPVLKIRNPIDGIQIPSVKIDRNVGRSEDDSKSFNSMGSKSTLETNHQRSAKGASHALMHPVKIVNKRDIEFTMSSSHKEVIQSKVDLLEAHLPRSLRNNHSSARQRLQLEHESEQQRVYRLLKGEVANGSGLSVANSVSSYSPVHYASGDWSVGAASNALVAAPSPILRRASGLGIANLEITQPPAAQGATLWETPTQHGMVTREEMKAAAEAAEAIAHSAEVLNAVDEQKARLEHKARMKVKLMNTMFANKIKLRDALRATALQLRPTPVMRTKKVVGISDYAIQNEALHVDFRNLAQKPDEEIDFEALEHAELPPFLQRVLTVKNLRGEGATDSRQSVTSLGSMSISSDVIRNLQDLGMSEIKEKLKDLAQYINSHTSRKIIDSWHLIEGRFKSSTHSKSVTEIDANGLAHPVKHPAITLSALAYMLCSAKIKVGHEELLKMTNKLGFISPDQTFQARRVAAMQVVLAMNEEVKSEHYETFKQEHWLLMKGGEPLVSLQEFIDIIFSSDPEEREQQFALIRNSRQEQVQAMIEEKKTKASMKQRAAARKKQMIDDFTVALATIQLMKGVLTPGKVAEFLEMVEKCKAYIEKQKEDQAASVPQDLILFLGLEAFPQLIQDLIKAKREQREAALRARRPSDMSVSTANSASNPFSKENLARKGMPTVVDDEGSVTSTTGSAHVHREIPRIQITPVVETESQRNLLNMRIPAYPRVHLAGPPPILDVIREMVSYGRGLQGSSYRDAIAVLQAVAATKMNSAFRCYRKRWRYSAARRMWIKHFHHVVSTHFYALRVHVVHNVNTRRYCWRKIKAWRYYTKRAHERRNTFRIAFWPFYVWHRYADAAGKAKDKATFLVGRVIPTLVTIKVFKAWKNYAKTEGYLNRTADKFNQKLVRADSAVLFRWLHEWAHKRHAIRRCWTIRGNTMRQRYFSRMILIPFYIWRLYTKYRVFARGHTKLNFHAMRRNLLHKKLPMRFKSNAEKRLALKLAELKRRIKHRRVSKVELKDKLKKRAKAKKESHVRKSNAVTPNRHHESLSESSDNESVGGGGGAGSGGGHARRRASSVRQSAVAGPVTSEIPQDLTEAVQALFKDHKFKWNIDVTEIYDVDSDQEDEEDLTPTLLNSYRNARISDIVSPDTYDFYAQMQPSTRLHAETVRGFYSYADHWNCFEASFRFHFFGYRAFQNMRYFATTRRKLKDYMAMRVRRIKMQILMEFRRILEIRTRRNATVRGSEAERLSQSVRAHHLAKAVRMRKFTAEVNNALGRDHDDEVDDEQARLKRIRALNLIDPDDEDYNEKEAQRLAERYAELKRQRIERDKKYTPPDLLAIDRADRDAEHKQAAEMVAFSKLTRETTSELVNNADQVTSDFREKLGRSHNMVLEVLDSESAVTSRAVEKQEAYMKQFKVHAANALIKALLKVYLEVQMSLMKEESKVYFRCLRLPMLLSRSKSMYYRKKLMNWIRICRRLNSISRKAHFYQTTRVKWCIFNRWLKYIAIEKLNPTPGIVKFLIRKTQLIPSFDEALHEDGFRKSVYLDNQRLNHVTSEFRNVFGRWKMLTQEDILFRILNDRARTLFRFRLLQKCFWAMKTGLDVCDYMKLIRAETTIFPIVRALADISQVVKKFIHARRKSLSTVMRRNNRKYSRYIKNDGQSSLSFKKFTNMFKISVNSRISTEQRLISDYFEIRGTQTFDDVHAPDRSHPIVPPTMARVSGKTFCDPHQITADGRSIAIPGGYKLSKVKFAFQYGFGVIGWQLFWSADGAKDLESPQRGAWHTASLTTHEFIIPKDDFLAGVEYLYDGDIMVGLRLKLFFGGFTRWLGGKTSLSTLSVYLDVSLAEREAYEDERDSGLHPDQINNPAFPYNFVIGFTGSITANRTTCLGLVVRKVIKQNLFSYSWVGDALWKEEMEKSEKDAMSTLPSIDLYSMPTHLSNYVTAPPVGPAPLDGGDSLTMSFGASNQDTMEEASVAESHAESTLQASTGTDEEDEASLDSADESSQQTGSVSESIPVPVKPRARRMGVSNPVVAKLLARPTERPNEPLTSSEVQFFDVLRMRTTELSHARSRALDFARNLWTNKGFRLDASLGKLVTIRIVAGLTNWYFNAISKRLMPLSVNEKPALVMLRRSRQLLAKADNVRNRVDKILANADVLESSAQPWTGKHLLSPKERAMRAEHNKRVAAMRAEAAKVKRDENFLRLQAVIDEKRGLAQMPKLTLSVFVVNNYRLKLAAARHKESLLERMTLEEVKTGLFGSNLREKLLSKEQMQAIHESLRSQQLKLKDVTSLDRLIDDVVEEEGEIAQKDKKRVTGIAASRKSSRQTNQIAAPVVSNSGTSSGKLSAQMALRLNSASLVNARTRSPPMLMTDRISAPSSPDNRDRSALSTPQGRSTGRESRSYSILEFNPFILPALPDKAESAILTSKAGSGANASPPKRNGSPNNRSRNSTPVQMQRPPRASATPPRANSMLGSFDKTTGAAKAPKTSRAGLTSPKRRLSTVLGDLDGDDSI